MRLVHPPGKSRQGLLFIATGHAYVQEAAESAIASRPHLDDVPITLVTDCVDMAKSFQCFDQVLPHPSPLGSYRDKITPLRNLPYPQTLFLDTDARLIASVRPLFSALGRAHLAAAHAPVRSPSGWNDTSVPVLFPELNSGVLLFRRSWRQRLLIQRWLRLYDQLMIHDQQHWDQASLRSVVWLLQQRYGFRLVLLPPEANLRTTKPWIAGKGLAVHVVHGRIPVNEWPDLIAYLNGDLSRFRTWSEWLTWYPTSQIRPKVSPDPRLR